MIPIPPIVYLAMFLGLAICAVLFQKGCQRGRQQRQEMWHQRQERWDEKREERKEDKKERQSHRFFYRRGGQQDQPLPPEPTPEPTPDAPDDQQRFFFRRRNK